MATGEYIRGRNRVTDGEPHVMASPVRLIAPLYQIHPRSGVAGRPDDGESCAFWKYSLVLARLIDFVRPEPDFSSSIRLLRGILFGNCQKLIFRNPSEKLLECKYLI